MQKGVFLETAHRIKFTPTMAKALGEELPIPDFAADLMGKTKVSQKIGKGYGGFREWLLQGFNDRYVKSLNN